MNRNNGNTFLFDICLFITVIAFLTIGSGFYLSQKNQVDYQNQVDFMWKISRRNYINRMNSNFNEKLDYIELLDWVDAQLDYVPIGEAFPRYTDPFEIIEYGRGRCGEHSRLYVAACIANGIEARLVRSFITDDHVWAEIKHNDTWMHVDSTDKYWNESLRRYNSGKNITRVIAYEPFGWTDITKRYINP